MPFGSAPGNSPPTIQLLPELARLLLSTPSVDEFLSDLAQTATSNIEPAASCGITLKRERQPFTVSSSDATANALDEVQYATHRGPCLQALDTGEVVTVTDTATETRWGAYPGLAYAQGVRSSLSLPLTGPDGTVGALNLYSKKVEAFGPADVRSAVALADQAGAVLKVVIVHAEQAQLTVQLREALASRSVIDQAIGMIMAAQECDAEAAFAMLRALSQNGNQKLHTVAQEMVGRVGRWGPREAS